MLFDIFDVMIILSGVFYYIVMGAGFVSDVSKIQGHTSSLVNLVAILFWPAFMFFRSLLSFLRSNNES